MGYTDSVGREARRVLFAQAVLTIVLAAGFALIVDRDHGWAALYGGAVTTALTLWLAWRVRDADQKGMAALFSGALARYALAALGIGVGIGYLRLPALPLLCAFAVTQFGFVVLWRRS